MTDDGKSKKKKKSIILWLLLFLNLATQYHLLKYEDSFQRCFGICHQESPATPEGIQHNGHISFWCQRVVIIYWEKT
jgi:hypothetical protein